VQVKEHDGKVIFLRKLVRGGADHSYGIQVANMAGLPDVVINRAKEILSNLESHTLDVSHDGNGAVQKTAVKKEAAKKSGSEVEKQAQLPQMTLFGSQLDPNVETLLNKLEASDPERMTPIEALLLLSELKRLAK
jgi:DNA mismatch repair protein MutS